MKKITIITDTICDLNIDLMEDNNIIYLPITIDINGEIYKDKIDITSKEFYDKITSGNIFPKTSQITPAVFEDAFKKELDKGNKVLCITVSAELSGTFNSANIAKGNLNSEDIFILDSETATLGQGMLVYEAAKMANEGRNISYILRHLDNIISTQSSLIALDTMEMLKRGGRVPVTLAAIGSMFNIKPILKFEDGTLKVNSKVRGKKSSIKHIKTSIQSSDIDTSCPIMIAYSGDDSDCKDMISFLNEKLPDVKIITSEVGPAIGTHAGIGALAIFFKKNS